MENLDGKETAVQPCEHGENTPKLVADIENNSTSLEDKLSNGECGNDLNNDSVDVDTDGDEFIWREYLSITKSEGVYSEAFTHVQKSYEPLFPPGVKLEIPNRDDSGTYWIGSVVTTCGSLLMLQYAGYDDNNGSDKDCAGLSAAAGEVWFDLRTHSDSIHPIGWCKRTAHSLSPPATIADRRSPESWQNLLTHLLLNDQTHTVHDYVLNMGCSSSGSGGKDPFTLKCHLVQEDTYLEILDPREPDRYIWIAKVMRNIGGRLLLKYHGIAGDGMDLWVFYTSWKLRPLGWGKSKPNIYHYKPPTHVTQILEGRSWLDLSSPILELCKVPEYVPVLKRQYLVFDSLLPQLGNINRIKIGAKLAVVDPHSPCHIRPATVSQLISKSCFEVTIDSLDNTLEQIKISCFPRQTNIFSIEWCKKRRISVTAPDGWKKTPFTWSDYLAQTKSKAVPSDSFQPPPVINHEFRVGEKLEVVDAAHSGCDTLSVGTVSAVCDWLLWVRVDEVDPQDQPTSYILHHGSTNLFPVGWSQSHGHRLIYPPQWRLAGQAPPHTSSSSHSVTPSSEGPDGGLNGTSSDADDDGAVDDDNGNAQSSSSKQQEAGNTRRTLSSDETAYLERALEAADRESQKFYNIYKETVPPPPLPPPSSGDPAVAGSGMFSPPIYINYTCATGPVLSRVRVSKLPQQIGPGHAIYVAKAILDAVVSSSFKRTNILASLRCYGRCKKGKEGMALVSIKLPVKKEPGSGSTTLSGPGSGVAGDPRAAGPATHSRSPAAAHRLTIRCQVPTRGRQMVDFCDAVCRAVGACPMLISPLRVPAGRCPEKCRSSYVAAGCGGRMLGGRVERELANLRIDMNMRQQQQQHRRLSLLGSCNGGDSVDDLLELDAADVDPFCPDWGVTSSGSSSVVNGGGWSNSPPAAPISSTETLLVSLLTGRHKKMLTRQRHRAAAAANGRGATAAVSPPQAAATRTNGKQPPAAAAAAKRQLKAKQQQQEEERRCQQQQLMNKNPYEWSVGELCLYFRLLEQPRSEMERIRELKLRGSDFLTLNMRHIRMITGDDDVMQQRGTGGGTTGPVYCSERSHRWAHLVTNVRMLFAVLYGNKITSRGAASL